MAETSTFSAIVDDAIARSQRRDRVLDIVGYARSTIRECQVLNGSFFQQDLIEDLLVTDADPFIWLRPVRLRSILAAQSPEFDGRGEPIYYKFLPPGTRRTNIIYYLYLSGGSYIFKGQNVGFSLPIAYFEYARRFKYYAIVAERPAIFDDELETWSYATAFDTDATTRAAGEELVSNWLLFNWYQLIVEGTLTKIFKSVGDDRSKASFALYKGLQKDLLVGEQLVYVGDARSLGK